MTLTNVERCHDSRCKVCAPTRQEYADRATHYDAMLEHVTHKDDRRDLQRQRRNVLRDTWTRRGPCSQAVEGAG